MAFLKINKLIIVLTKAIEAISKKPEGGQLKNY
jgi:hypothetical protein